MCACADNIANVDQPRDQRSSASTFTKYRMNASSKSIKYSLLLDYFLFNSMNISFYVRVPKCFNVGNTVGSSKFFLFSPSVASEINKIQVSLCELKKIIQLLFTWYFENCLGVLHIIASAWILNLFEVGFRTQRNPNF